MGWGEGGGNTETLLLNMLGNHGLALKPVPKEFSFKMNICANVSLKNLVVVNLVNEPSHISPKKRAYPAKTRPNPANFP
jgi:hypothetical protein